MKLSCWQKSATNKNENPPSSPFAKGAAAIRLPTTALRPGEKRGDLRSRSLLSAFTLVEVMLVAVLFSIMFGVAFDVLISGRKSFDAASIRYDIQSNAALGLNNMARELKNSAFSKITISGGGDSVKFTVPIGYDGNGDIIWGADAIAGNQIRYEINGQDQLARDRLDALNNPVNGTTRILAHYVDNVSFSNQTNGLTMNITVSEKGQSESLSSRLTFRN